MDPAVFDDLERTFAADGPDAAVRRLCDRLRQEKDYHALFYALLMHKRQQLGVSPIPTGPALPPPGEKRFSGWKKGTPSALKGCMAGFLAALKLFGSRHLGFPD